ncbi:hypothetical protein RB195_001820 [Necator americanus]|uniref:G-protein coupled receptors family 1 profile domain-containing protein n=1 Tax=Necator americanus TaxID=51031 RepID=A0ABR1DG30_NECAM
MLTEFDETCGCIGLQLNLQKTMFMRNGWVSDAPFTLNGTNISECTSYVYLGRELNMMNDLTPGVLGRRRRAAWGAYKSIEDVVKKTRNTRLRAHLFNTTVLPALTYASETWAFRNQEENAVSVIERAIERVMLGGSRFTQVRDGSRSSLLRQRSKIRDAAAFAKKSKIRGSSVIAIILYIAIWRKVKYEGEAKFSPNDKKKDFDPVKMCSNRYYWDRTVVKVFFICCALPFFFALPSLLFTVLTELQIYQNSVVNIISMVILDLTTPIIWFVYIAYIAHIRRGLSECLCFCSGHYRSNRTTISQ